MGMPRKKKGLHRHHIIPKHAGGEDTPENIVYLTPEDHAKAHLELYEKYGRVGDLMAYNYLITNWCNGRAMSGYKQTQEHVEKRIANIDYEQVSKKLKGRVSPTKGMKFGEPSEETKQKISEATTGKRKDNSKGLMGQAWKGKESPNSKGYYCIGCQEKVPPSRITRHEKCFREFASRGREEIHQTS